jgi:cyclomaltodextrinase
MPEWTEHVIWWHVYPLGFVGADTTGRDRAPAHRLRQLESWLDYLLELGANGLALGPIFRSSSHGYDTVDYFEVDPRLGDDADFDRLLEAAHARGIRVMLDGVFNHVGREYPALRTAMADPDAPEAALFRLTASGDLDVFEGHSSLVAFDHTNPRVAEHVVSVINHWLDRGVDAWRLDAAYSVSPAFWSSVLPRVTERHPDVFVVGEVLHGDYARFVRDAGMDSVTQYELWQAVWHSIADLNFFELDWALQRHNEFLETFVPYTFVGNHDVSRLATQIGDARHRAHALVLLFTLGGIPSVYYGDERGFEGVKEQRAGGDDAIRPAYPRTPDELSGEGDDVFALHRELIGLRRRHPWLHRATTTTIELTNKRYVYEVAAGAERLVVALNLGDDAFVVSEPAGSASVQVVAGVGTSSLGGVSVSPHDWVVLGT